MAETRSTKRQRIAVRSAMILALAAFGTAVGAGLAYALTACGAPEKPGMGLDMVFWLLAIGVTLAPLYMERSGGSADDRTDS